MTTRVSAKKHENEMSQEECLAVLRKCVEKSPIPGIQKRTLQNITKVTCTEGFGLSIGKSSETFVFSGPLLITIEENKIFEASCVISKNNLT